MPEVFSLVKSPQDAYHSMVDKGKELADKSLMKAFHQSFYAGCYIGFGGALSMVISGGIADASEANPTLQTFVFAALFPVNLLIILLSGGVLYTGTTATVAAAVIERKTHWINIPKTFLVSWIGNLLGGLVFALMLDYCDINTGLTAKHAVKIAEKKITADFMKTTVKGIGCNWMVCIAVFLSGQAQDMAGKMVGIWFPISAFVAIGFEHIPANMFMIPLGMLAGADVTVQDMLLKNFLPTTLGNTIAGSLIVAGGYSFAFGRLGQSSPSQKSFGGLNDTWEKLGGRTNWERMFSPESPAESPRPAADDAKDGKIESTDRHARLGDTSVTLKATQLGVSTTDAGSAKEFA